MRCLLYGVNNQHGKYCLDLEEAFYSLVDDADKVLKVFSSYSSNYVINTRDFEGFLHFGASSKFPQNFFSRIDAGVYADQGFWHSNRPNIHM